MRAQLKLHDVEREGRPLRVPLVGFRTPPIGWAASGLFRGRRRPFAVPRWRPPPPKWPGIEVRREVDEFTVPFLREAALGVYSDRIDLQVVTDLDGVEEPVFEVRLWRVAIWSHRIDVAATADGLRTRETWMMAGIGRIEWRYHQRRDGRLLGCWPHAYDIRNRGCPGG